MTKVLLLCLALVPGFASAQDAPAVAAAAPVEAQTGPATAPYYTAGGEGKTLPENVMRFRLPFKFLRGDKAYDEDGKAVDLPVDVSVNAGAIVLEYGLSDRLSLQLKTNFFMSQKVTAKSDSDIKATDAYKDNYAAALLNPEVEATKVGTVEKVAQAFADAGKCPSLTACRTLINGGLKATDDTDLGSGLVVPTGVAFKDAISAAVEDGVSKKVVTGVKDAAERDGKSGIGDTDIGALYSVLTKEESPIAFSVGGGLRIPTGTMLVDADQIPTGRGTTDLGLRFNLDYPPVPGLMFSWQNQTEVMLMKGKTKETDENLKRVTVDIERTGLRNVGFLKMAFGLGMINESVAPLGLYSSYNYDFDAKTKIDGTEVSSKAPRSYTVTFGTTLDGLALRLPVQLELEYEMSVGGRNATALNAMGTTLKAFYRF